MNSSGAPPPPPPPMPPPPEHMDPSEARPFLDPYGRAKTVRIGKWRWPPPKTEQDEGSDSFLQFKLRQHQRKTTPQQNLHAQVRVFYFSLLFFQFYKASISIILSRSILNQTRGLWPTLLT